MRKGTSRSRQTHREAFERRPARRARDRHWLCEELLMDFHARPRHRCTAESKSVLKAFSISGLVHVAIEYKVLNYKCRENV